MPATQAQRNLQDQQAVYIANPPPPGAIPTPPCGHLGATSAPGHKLLHPLSRTLTRNSGHSEHAWSNPPNGSDKTPAKWQLEDIHSNPPEGLPSLDEMLPY